MKIIRWLRALVLGLCVFVGAAELGALPDRLAGTDGEVRAFAADPNNQVARGVVGQHIECLALAQYIDEVIDYADEGAIASTLMRYRILAYFSGKTPYECLNYLIQNAVRAPLGLGPLAVPPILTRMIDELRQGQAYIWAHLVPGRRDAAFMTDLNRRASQAFQVLGLERPTPLSLLPLIFPSVVTLRGLLNDTNANFQDEVDEGLRLTALIADATPGTIQAWVNDNRNDFGIFANRIHDMDALWARMNAVGVTNEQYRDLMDELVALVPAPIVVPQPPVDVVVVAQPPVEQQEQQRLAEQQLGAQRYEQRVNAVFNSLNALLNDANRLGCQAAALFIRRGGLDGLFDNFSVAGFTNFFSQEVKAPLLPLLEAFVLSCNANRFGAHDELYYAAQFVEAEGQTTPAQEQEAERQRQHFVAQQLLNQQPIQPEEAEEENPGIDPIDPEITAFLRGLYPRGQVVEFGLQERFEELCRANPGGNLPILFAQAQREQRERIERDRREQEMHRRMNAITRLNQGAGRDVFQRFEILCRANPDGDFQDFFAQAQQGPPPPPPPANNGGGGSASSAPSAPSSNTKQKAKIRDLEQRLSALEAGLGAKQRFANDDEAEAFAEAPSVAVQPPVSAKPVDVIRAIVSPQAYRDISQSKSKETLKVINAINYKSVAKQADPAAAFARMAITHLTAKVKTLKGSAKIEMQRDIDRLRGALKRREVAKSARFAGAKGNSKAPVLKSGRAKAAPAAKGFARIPVAA